LFSAKEPPHSGLCLFFRLIILAFSLCRLWRHTFCPGALSFLCNFLGAPYIFLGQVWAESKGELAASRFHADYGQCMCIAMISPIVE